MQYLNWIAEHWSSITTDTVTFVYAIEKAGGLRTIISKFMGPKPDVVVTSTQTSTQSNEKSTPSSPVVQSPVAG